MDIIILVSQLKYYKDYIIIVKMDVKYGEQEEELVVHVVDEDGPNLLDRDWLTRSNVNLPEVHKITTIKGNLRK